VPAPTNNHITLSRELELVRIVPLDQAVELSTLSLDTLEREHADKIITLSPRRRGMRLRHALLLSDPSPANTKPAAPS
jgi:hypothetical protein